MAIALRNVTTVDQSAGAATIVITKPTGTVDGDVLLAFIEYAGNLALTAPGGWTLLDTADGGATNQRTSSYVKLASGEPSSWTWSASANIWEGTVSSWTGVDNVTKTEGDVGATGAVSPATASTLTPTSADDLSVVGFTTVNSSALSLPASYANVASFGSNGDIVRIASLQLASNAATGTTTSTQTGASQWTAQRVLLKTGSATTVVAPMMRPATMQFRAGNGALLAGRIAARILPQPNSVVFVQGSGAAVCRVTCSGTITGTGAVSGAAVARVTAAGTVTGAGALSGAALARVTASATVAGLGALSGVALCRVTATGTIGTGGLTGAAVVLVLARGTVTGAGALTGTAVCRVTAQWTVTNGAAVSTETSYAWAT